MQIYTHTLPGGAQLIGYLRDRTVEMPAFNTRPAILILPGGGYAWCSRREADPVAMQFLQAGYNVFTLYYTCRSDETVPALRWQPLIDAAGAILHIRRNAEQFGTDPAKIAICGFSAGGHLALSGAVLDIPGETAQQRPDAVILGYPVITAGKDAHRGSFVQLAGSEDAAAQRAFGLEDKITPDTPPVFVWHTMEDRTVPVENTLLLLSALRRAGVACEAHLFEQGVHGTSISTAEVDAADRHRARWVTLCLEWLGRTVGFDLR